MRAAICMPTPTPPPAQASVRARDESRWARRAAQLCSSLQRSAGWQSEVAARRSVERRQHAESARRSRERTKRASAAAKLADHVKRARGGRPRQHRWVERHKLPPGGKAVKPARSPIVLVDNPVPSAPGHVRGGAWKGGRLVVGTP